MDPRALADGAAAAVLKAFDRYHRAFAEITRRARARFEERDWVGMQADATLRLDLYKQVIDDLLAEVRAALGERRRERALWILARESYRALIAERKDLELAQTFFNSLTRKVLVTIGIDREVEFIPSPAEAPFDPEELPIFKSYFLDNADPAPVESLIREILADCRLKPGFQDRDGDARLVAQRLEAHLKDRAGSARPDVVEVVRPLFYRNNAAYVVGRIRRGGSIVPMVLALLNREGGIAVDAALFDDDDVSIVFSFTRSYFHVDVDKPRKLVDFLRSMMPHKPLAELYISIGYNKHGKTELYKDLLRHLESSEDKFEVARGERGMVMAVFTLPSYDVVFKVIKDRFNYTKKATRQTVLDKYHLVFRHDRAGRLVDAQEFEHLQFKRSRFSEDLLRELLDVASQSVALDGESVVIKHLYTERRLAPLNLYLKETTPEKARAAVADYGNAIKDLAAANIFPGDILLKNFGVTRHERVVFYDYDELCLLTDCRIREFPAARDENEELEAEPWFYVGETDIFPEEFRTFLGFEGELRETFIARHRDLFTVDFWTALQEKLRRGEIADIFPYKDACRLRPAS